jgi:hypothetical protein
MAIDLDKNKQIAVISALAEGSSILPIERITGVHRDTIMRLGVRVGHGLAKVLDHLAKRHGTLRCTPLQVAHVTSPELALRTVFIQEYGNLEPAEES